MDESRSGADWRTRWIARVGSWMVWLLARTWRMRYVADAELNDARQRNQPVIYVVWHGFLLPALWSHRGRQISVLISEHRDGEIIARIAHSLGFRTVRGSSSRGANRALIGLVKDLEAGYSVALTPDGPRGPFHSFAAGALLVAQRSGCPILPVGAHASSAWHFKSWDQFVLPKPFARVTIAYSPFMIPPPDVSPKALSDTVHSYQAALDRAMAAAGNASAPDRAGA